MYRALIRKDFLVGKDTLGGIMLLGILMSCGFYYAYPQTPIALILPSVMVIFLGFSVLSNQLKVDHSTPLLIASPYGRSKLLAARYIGWTGYGLLSMLLGVLATGFLYALPFSFLPKSYYSLSTLLTALAIVVIFLAIIIAAYTLFSPQVVTTIFLLGVLLVNLLPKLLRSVPIRLPDPESLLDNPGLLLPAVLCLFLSYFISRSLYHRREF